MKGKGCESRARKLALVEILGVYGFIGGSCFAIWLRKQGTERERTIDIVAHEQFCYLS